MNARTLVLALSATAASFGAGFGVAYVTGALPAMAAPIAATFAEPTLPEALTVRREPKNGHVPVAVRYEQPPEPGGPPGATLKWSEQLACPNAAALTFFQSCKVVDDGSRPAEWPNPLPRYDAGPGGF